MLTATASFGDWYLLMAFFPWQLVTFVWFLLSLLLLRNWIFFQTFWFLHLRLYFQVKSSEECWFYFSRQFGWLHPDCKFCLAFWFQSQSILKPLLCFFGLFHTGIAWWLTPILMLVHTQNQLTVSPILFGFLGPIFLLPLSRKMDFLLRVFVTLCCYVVLYDESQL